MPFSSSIFLFGFLPFTLLFYYSPLCKTIARKNGLLLLASIFFYAWGEPIFVFVMLFSILLNFFAVKKMDLSVHRKLILTFCVIWNLAILFIFKYTGFFCRTIRRIFGVNIPLADIALPIGISFFTFQILSYVLDVYYKKVPAQKSIANLALYISLFPQLIAGPIVRYDAIENQIENRTENFSDFSCGLRRFVVGLSKKCILADCVSFVAAYYFSAPQNTSPILFWLGAIAYSFQIYFDFSGYSDMAIGLGKMFGFDFAENFNYPYAAKSVTDFWRRWHISLSSWFRDYVYIVLGGNRVRPARHILNLLVVWALTGLWHGAAWNFVLWGLYYFVLLVFEKMIFKNAFLSEVRSKTFFKIVKIIWRIFTLIFIVTGWTIFRSDSLEIAFANVARLFDFSAFVKPFDFAEIKSVAVIFSVCTIASLPVSKLKIFRGKFCAFKNLFALALFALCVCRIIGGSYSPFIYFNF